jgi:hypothetical protein
MVAIEPRLRGDVRLKDFLDGLEFAKVVAAADAAKRGIKGGGVKSGVGQDAVCVAVPRLIERVQPLGQLVEPQLARSYRAQTGPCRSRCRSRPVAGECDQPERRSRRDHICRDGDPA